MEILECKNQRIKISKGSITVKNDNDKTAGVVKNIISLFDIQANKQYDFYSKLKKSGINPMDIGLKNIIIKDDTMYFFRNIKHKLYCEEHGYPMDIDREHIEKENVLYNKLLENGYEVIECIYE